MFGKKTRRVQIRHGDVLLTKVDDLRPPIHAPRLLSTTLAIGEQTGHSHVLTAAATNVEAIPDDDLRQVQTPVIYDWTAADGRRYVVVEGGVTVLNHPEHGPVQVEPGTYEIRRQRQWTESERRARFVQD